MKMETKIPNYMGNSESNTKKEVYSINICIKKIIKISIKQLITELPKTRKTNPMQNWRKGRNNNSDISNK